MLDKKCLFFEYKEKVQGGKKLNGSEWSIIFRNYTKPGARGPEGALPTKSCEIIVKL